MHHPKLLRSKGVRSAMIPAVLLCVTVSACADQQLTEPTLLPRVARSSNVPFDRFFAAWSQSYSSSPIRQQLFALDTRQDRQFSGFYPDPSVMAFASANPGRMYIHGDEPDQWCFDPYEYAGMYHAFVLQVRAADPTARVSPAGFAEPNDRCCSPGDETCRQGMHSIGYADQFYNAYIRRFGAPPRVDEWRFHDFGTGFAAGDVNGWWARVDRAAAWSVSHGANMVLGAWGFIEWRHPTPDFQEHMKQVMGRLINDNRINGAVYWSLERWVDSPRPLVNEEGNLTEVGQTHVNPLTDVPTGLKLAGSASGQAKLRWNNTTYAWPAEVEFWVQAPGSNDFVYQRTERLSGAAGTQTPFVAFRKGDKVRARVRYYNVYGQASWSPFSNTVTLPSTGPGADQGTLGKRPLFCVLQLC